MEFDFDEWTYIEAKIGIEDCSFDHAFGTHVVKAPVVTEIKVYLKTSEVYGLPDLFDVTDRLTSDGLEHFKQVCLDRL